MINPRGYPDEIKSAETSRPLRRGIKMLTIEVDGHSFRYGQPGWWALIEDSGDTDGQLTDEDNVYRAAACLEARASAKHSTLTPLAAKRPDPFRKESGMPMMSEAVVEVIRETVRKSSIDRIYERIYGSHEQKRASS